MIRMIQSRSAAQAKAYFSDALAKSDYYLGDQELPGRMRGKLADRLALAGPVSKDVFFALCENRDPRTNAPLTPRTKDERTTGYDISFHAPKSVSILHALSGDDQVLRAFQTAVRETMQDLEADVRTRVRKAGAMDERQTGELIWSEFIHQTARPVDGHAPDPHLHAHNYVFNCTWDEVEQQVKAGQFREIKRDMPYYQARFHKRLSDGLLDLGYGIRRTERAFEVAGVPQRVIDLFAKRTDEIGRVAAEQGITDAKELADLGARTRSKKQKGRTMADLQADWRRQIADLGPDTDGEGQRILRYDPDGREMDLTAEQCVQHALDHGFERASVLDERRLLEAAYRHSLGRRDVTLEAVTDGLRADDRLIHVEDRGRTSCTTRAVLAEEQRMVTLARQGQGRLRPLYAQAPELDLDGQQAEAVRHVLTTPHRVSIIRGAAGSGKTTLMREAIDRIEAAGKTVTVVAPTAEASRGVLRQEGMREADTVARLLSDPQQQEALSGQVLWVDEAGLLGTGDMTALLELTTRQNARLILGGDTRQHRSVVRGDALRILNTVGGIPSAEVSKIYRQRNADYRAAVEDLARGDVRRGFEKLDALGAIQSIDPLKPHETLVNDYAAIRQRGKSALVIAPTHEQGEAVTAALRERLKEKGLLGKKDYAATRLTSLNRTEAEKADWRTFSPGQVVQFNQNVPGIGRGSVWTIESASEAGVRLGNGTQQGIPLPLTKAGAFEVYRKGELPLSKGDPVRITRNGFDEDKNRLNNGQTLEVVRIGKQGDLLLRNPISQARYRLDREFGHLAHAYCITSYAAQGKTVDEVLIAQPAATFPATDAKQFYVSVSRGRDRARIYTDDREQLLAHAARLGDRTSALELLDRRNPSLERAQQRIRADVERPVRAPQPERTRTTKERDHEPGL
jgi:conjugative relaxase-like TrwC/TraI family protein